MFHHGLNVFIINFPPFLHDGVPVLVRLIDQAVCKPGAVVLALAEFCPHKKAPVLRAGENEIRVEVVNNWRNRLIGDARLPEAERKTYATVNPYNADSELQVSGLLGPVRLER